MNVLKTTVKKLLYHGGYYHALGWLDGLRYPGSRLVILVYHNISDGREFDTGAHHPFQIRPVLTRSVFDLHLRILKQSYDVVDLETGLARLTADPKSDRMVAITFDDGYRSFLEIAFPLLQAYGIPATVFLPTDFVGQKRFFWWDRLNQAVYLLQEQPPDPSALGEILGESTASGLLSSRADRLGAIRYLQELERTLIPLSDAKRDGMIAALEALLPQGSRARITPEPMLNWNQVRELSKRNVHFGSHTCSHLTFGVAAPAQVESELKASRAAIEDCLQKPATGFAFPYGADLESYRKAVPILRRRGYTHARTTAWAYNTSSTDRFLLNRAHIDFQPSATLARRDMVNNFLMRSEA